MWNNGMLQLNGSNQLESQSNLCFLWLICKELNVNAVESIQVAQFEIRKQCLDAVTMMLYVEQWDSNAINGLESCGKLMHLGSAVSCCSRKCLLFKMLANTLTCKQRIRCCEKMSSFLRTIEIVRHGSLGQAA